MKNILDDNVIMEDMNQIYSRGYDWEKFDNKSFLITGAYGMLASYMVYYLIYLIEIKKLSIEVYIQGRDSEKARKRYGEYLLKSYLHFINDDILSDNGGEIPKTDYIIHAAGIANPRLYSTHPVEVIEPNVIGTHRLLKSCIGRKTEGFLFFSTGDVYGRVIDAKEITEETLGFVDPLDEHSCYGESKRLAETLCSSFFREYGIRTIIARIGHTYGPTMDIENDPRVFANFMKSAIYGEDIVLYSDGKAKRPFCYLTDAIAGYFLLLLEGKGGEAYNVTNTDQMISIIEVARIISKIPAKPINVIHRERDKGDTYQKNIINIENKPIEDKLCRLGWTHSIDVKEGFTRVYQYLKNQRG